jgi:hypothetical protein
MEIYGRSISATPGNPKKHTSHLLRVKRQICLAGMIADWQHGLPSGILSLVSEQGLLEARDVVNISIVCRNWREELSLFALARFLPAWLESEDSNVITAAVAAFIGMGPLALVDLLQHPQTQRSALNAPSKLSVEYSEAVIKHLLQNEVSRLLALHIAAAGGHEAIVKTLLAEPWSKVNHVDDANRTPLYLAARFGHEAVVNRLLEAPGCNVNHASDQGATPLFMAAFFGHGAVLKRLLEAPGCDVNKVNNHGRSPLMMAAANGHEENVTTLIESPGCDVNQEDVNGRTALCIAARSAPAAKKAAIMTIIVEAPGCDAGEKGQMQWVDLVMELL